MTTAKPSGSGGDDVAFRAARVSDAARIWQIVNDSGVLDRNSSYAYLLFCRHFGATSVVAELAGEVGGFITAFRPPGREEVVFVWQVAVDEALRGRRVARRMLHALVRLPGCEGVRFLETTVTPSNEPSRKLFRSFARHESAECSVGTGFTADQFPEGGHEAAEELFRIGPFDRGRDPS